LPEELAADNRALLVALRRAAARSGAQLVEKRVEDLSQNRADLVVVANGFQAPGLLPRLPVRAVKGEIVRLGRGPKAVEAPGRTIRALVRGRHVYLVPRPDGVVVGATELEGDARPDVSATAVAELLADAIAVAPGLADYDFAEASSGFRPVTPDRCPLLGWADEARRVLVATGHGRDGMLLAPLTADLAVALLAGDQLSAEESELSLAMDPSRSGLR
jgi:glycine oxidase